MTFASAPLPLRKPSLVQPITAGVLAALVGFASSAAIVLQGLLGVGATPAEAASGLMALCLAQGLLAIILGLRHRSPITLAWSTPGAALLAGAGVPHGGFGVAVTAFLITALLIIISGIWKPLGRAVSAIPPALANAMLAGVLMEMCIAPLHALQQMPLEATFVILSWALGWRFANRYAVLVAVAVTGIIVARTSSLPPEASHLMRPALEFVAPVIRILPALGIAIPLFIVTMASQNVPGITVLQGNGYKVPVAEVFTMTGLFSAVGAFFGGHVINLAAITAALCAGPEAGPEPKLRYVASVTTGVIYIGLAFAAGFATSFIVASPPVLIQAVAGLALFSSLAAAMSAAMQQEDHRLFAIITFVTTLSGVSILGIAAPFWGLMAGGTMIGLSKLKG